MLSLIVRQVRLEGAGIHSFELVDPDGASLPTFGAGAHVDVHLGNGLVRQYSLCNDPAERHRYVIAVLREERGRGGSRHVHDHLHVGHRLRIGRPRNHFPLQRTSGRVLLVAGGIGITPLKAMLHELERAGADYQLHYCAKDRRFAAFHDALGAPGRSHRVHFHFDGGDPARSLDLADLLAAPQDGEQLYYCGPPGFMAACARASAHWASGTVHSEHFKAPERDTVADAGGAVAPDTFDAVIQSTGQRIHVAAGQSLVQALRATGIEIDTSCESGLCGTCRTGYVSGDVDHRDYILDEEERRHCLTACVSRARGTLVLAL